MANNIPTPHISAKEGEIAPSILLPGDPLRAKYIAENFLAGAKQFNSTRNMFGYTGFYRDKPISVMGTGMGCASMGIYSHELMNFYGVKKLVRVGTAGAMQKTTHIRDLVLAMGACTGTGYVKELGLPDGYSCIADFGLLIKAALEAEQRGLSYHVGNVLTSDVFYAPEKAKKEGVGYEDVGNGDGGPLRQRCAGRRPGAFHSDHFRLPDHRRVHHGRGTPEFLYGYGTGGSGDPVSILDLSPVRIRAGDNKNNEEKQ